MQLDEPHLMQFPIAVHPLCDKCGCAFAKVAHPSEDVRQSAFVHLPSGCERDGMLFDQPTIELRQIDAS